MSNQELGKFISWSFLSLLSGRTVIQKQQIEQWCVASFSTDLSATELDSEGVLPLPELLLTAADLSNLSEYEDGQLTIYNW